MPREGLRSQRLTRLVLLVTLLIVAPACSSSAGNLRGNGEGRGLGGRLADRLAYRPVYPEPNPVPRTRPIYLSGYAGAQYGPDARARRPVYPTTFQYVPSPWLEFLRSRR